MVETQAAEAERNVSTATIAFSKVTVYCMCVCYTYSEAHVSRVVSHDVKQTTELVALVDFQLEALVFSNVGIMT